MSVLREDCQHAHPSRLHQRGDGADDRRREVEPPGQHVGYMRRFARKLDVFTPTPVARCTCQLRHRIRPRATDAQRPSSRFGQQAGQVADRAVRLRGASDNTLVRAADILEAFQPDPGTHLPVKQPALFGNHLPGPAEFLWEVA